jgi:hypothetical protein
LSARSASAGVHAALATLAVLLWAVSVPLVDLSAMSGWGLLTAVPVTWWLAAASTAPYMVAALQGRCPTWVLCMYHAALLAVLFGTTAATYPVPRLPWTYKHVGVVEHMLATGEVDRTIDIYNNWPGFFLAAAGAHRLTGVSPLDLAQWSEPFFAAATSAALVFAVRGLTRDRRVVWVTLLVFTLGNWVAQSYFAPQALAMVLALLFLGGVLRWLPVRDATGRPAPRMLTAALLRGRDLAPLARGRRRAPVWGLPLATLVYAGVVVTHQLTPIALLMQVVALALLVKVRRLWVIGLWMLTEAAWVAYAWEFVQSHWRLFAPDGLATPTSKATLVPSLPGVSVAHSAPSALVGVVGLLAMCAFIWRYARRSVEVVPAALAAAPPMILAVQSYGGEGIFRAYLYALPWLSYLIALLAMAVWSGRRWRRWLLATLTAALTILTLLATLGAELLVYLPEQDVAASRWFEANTPKESYAVRLDGASVPLLVTENYPEHMRPSRALNEMPGFTPGRTSPRKLLHLARKAFAENGPGGYFVMTEEQRTFSRVWGQASQTQLTELVAAISTSKDYRVVYRRGRNVIAQYVGPLPAPRTGPSPSAS